MSDLEKRQGTEIEKPGKRGFEEPVRREELIIPRAALLQALSPQVQEGNAKQGQIINSLTGEELPQLFIPIFKYTEWIRFNSRDTNSPGFVEGFEPGQLIWRSNDPMDPRVQKEGRFGEHGELPLATQFMNFFCMFPGVGMPIVIGFSKTSFGTGKKLYSLASFLNTDMFAMQYKLTSQKETNPKGTYFVFRVEPAGKTDPENFAIAEQLWEKYHAKELAVDELHKEEGEEKPF